MAPCCAPGCQSNYKRGKYVTSFKFPSNKEVRAKWINLMPRKNWRCTKNSVLCIKHFCAEDIIDCIVFTDQDGSTKRVKSEKITLKRGALPSIWPGMPSSVTAGAPTKKRKLSEDEQNAVIREEADAEVSQFLESDAVRNYEDFFTNCKAKLSSMSNRHWRIASNDNCTVIFIMNIEETPTVQVSVKVGKDLGVSVWVDMVLVGDEQLAEIIPKCKLEQWFQLENLLCHYSSSMYLRINLKDPCS